MTTTPFKLGDPPVRDEVVFDPAVVKKVRPANNPTTKSGGAWQKFWATPKEEQNPEPIQPYLGFAPAHIYNQAKMGVRDLVVGTWDLGKDILGPTPWSQTFQKDVVDPLQDQLNLSADMWKQGRYSEAAGHYIASYLPFVGPWAVEKGEQLGRRDVGGTLANVGATVLAAEAAKPVAETAREGSLRAAKRGIRYVTGAGETAGVKATKVFTDAAAADRAAAQAKAVEVAGENRQKLSDARATHDERVADIERENRISATETQNTNRQTMDTAQQSHEQRAAEIDAENKQLLDNYEVERQRVQTANETSKAAVQQGQDAELVAQQSGQTVSEALPKLADAERVKAKARYPTVAGQVNKPRLLSALNKVIDQKLLGAGRVPTSLGRVLDVLGEPEGMIDTPEGLKPASPPMGVKDLHGMYSELGEELFSRDLPGDSKAALGAARKVVLDELQRFYNAANKGDEFVRAQASWTNYENTFRNTDPTIRGGSPLARALQARDPVTGQLRPDYVRSILQDTKAYRIAQQLLRRYGATELQDTLKTMKEQADRAKAAPKKVRVKAEPKAPTLTEQPTSARIGPLREPVTRDLPTSARVSGLKQAPPVPPIQPFDLEQWRNEQLEKTAINWQRLRPYDFMNWRLPFTVTQQVLARMLANPRFRKAIARNP